MDSWTLEGETLYPWSDRKFSRVEMSSWLFCRDGLQRRSSMYCISLDFRRDKEGESEAKSWPSRCGLSLNFWDRTVQMNWVERWVFGSAQVKAKIIYNWSADGWSGPDVFKLQGPWGTVHSPVSLLIAHRTWLVEFSRVWTDMGPVALLTAFEARTQVPRLSGAIGAVAVTGWKAFATLGTLLRPPLRLVPLELMIPYLGVWPQCRGNTGRRRS